MLSVADVADETSFEQRCAQFCLEPFCLVVEVATV